jgi:2-polyprenyl-3-methyl-5-hydroxy-6-metoxy-1,4-benzoquinol methylase
MTTTAPAADTVATEIETFANRLFQDGVAALEVLTVTIGHRLGLYRILAERGPSTAAELAGAAGIAERYAREWLEQQAAAGIVSVDEVDAPADQRRFRLPEGHAHVLLEQDSEAYMVPLSEGAAAAYGWVPMLLDAFRTGTGIAYPAFGIDGIQAAFSRPSFRNHLAQTWLPALPEVHAKLVAGTARVCEIGCGQGVAAVTIAEAFPSVRIDAYDSDDASIAAARKRAADAGVVDRVRFEVRDATGLAAGGDYDLVWCAEVIHDAADPVGILTAMRGLRSPDGIVLVVDERVPDRFEAPADPVQRLLYAISLVHCLPAGMHESPSAATGTVMRPSTLRRYATDAGFTEITMLPVEHPQLALYRLDG